MTRNEHRARDWLDYAVDGFTLIAINVFIICFLLWVNSFGPLKGFLGFVPPPLGFLP